MYHHILVPTDGSTLAEAAARDAAQLAKGFNARITAVHVIPRYTQRSAAALRPPGRDPMTADEYRRLTEEAGNAALRKVAAQAKAANVPVETLLVTNDETWEGILDAVRDKACDLIVMASHNRVGLERIFLGSVATEVLTHSTTPVLVCRDRSA